jgi:CRP/FNR family cyclic AMP-dependent transcriptional regulator
MLGTGVPFSHIDEASLRMLAPRGTARIYRKNVVVANEDEGDDTDSLYVLLSGRVKVFIARDDGREVVVHTIEVGDYFVEATPGAAKPALSRMCI